MVLGVALVFALGQVPAFANDTAKAPKTEAKAGKKEEKKCEHCHETMAKCKCDKEHKDEKKS
jgi:hypothetical protein